MSPQTSPIQPWQISDFSLVELIAAGKRVTRESCKKSLRIAILGDCATQHYAQCLSTALKIRGFWPEVYEAEFDTIAMELGSPASGLNVFKPEVVVFFNCVQKLESQFSEHQNENFVEKTVSEISAQWERFLRNHKATIVQHAFCVPLDFTYGNSSKGHEGALAYSIMEINRSLFSNAQKMGNVRIVDTDFQASLFGKLNWFDEGLWCQAKQALSPRYLPPLVKAVSDAVLEGYGIGVKCVVLDLDNTTWGGILGDVGMNGIELGELNGIGGVFCRFQKAMKRLKERGILLAVCSKNDQRNVDEVFENHPEMVLRPADIVISVANYQDKVTNIRTIQKELNIGFDSFVFLDDSPIERDFVRQMLPDVQVPNLPEDPAAVLGALAKWNFFDASRVSQEDTARTSLYKADEERKKIREASGDYESYLQALETVAEIEPFNEFTIVRAHQLLQRSNQFNLTTRRHSEAHLKEMMKGEDYLAFTVRLRDRVSDHGIISILIGKAENNEFVIDSWVMSCRVLGRHVEDVLYNSILKFCREKRLTTVRGEYIKTNKNSMVLELLPKFGFQKLKSEKETDFYNLSVETAPFRKNLPMKLEYLGGLKNDET